MLSTYKKFKKNINLFTTDKYFFIIGMIYIIINNKTKTI
jgi:hypothetical protein